MKEAKTSRTISFLIPNDNIFINDDNSIIFYYPENDAKYLEIMEHERITILVQDPNQYINGFNFSFGEMGYYEIQDRPVFKNEIPKKLHIVNPSTSISRWEKI
jgi:hypothetical protein